MNPSRRDPAEHAEAVPLGVEQHLVALQQTGPQQKRPAVRQPHMGDLQLRAFATDDRVILAPVELERLPRLEHQRHTGASPRRLFLALAPGPPFAGECRHPVVGAG